MNKTTTAVIFSAAIAAVMSGCVTCETRNNIERFEEGRRLVSASLGVLGDVAERENALTCWTLLTDAETGEFVAADGFWGDKMLSIIRYAPWHNSVFNYDSKLSELFMPDYYGRSFGGFYCTYATGLFPTNAPRFNVAIALVIPKTPDDKEHKPKTTADDVLPEILKAMAEEVANPMGDVLEFLRKRFEAVEACRESCGQEQEQADRLAALGTADDTVAPTNNIEPFAHERRAALWTDAWGGMRVDWTAVADWPTRDSLAAKAARRWMK